MDAVLAWRPWRMNDHWKPVTEGLHLDQNPFSKPGFEVVQGMVPLYAVTTESGGLEVVPRSHTDAAKTQWKSRYPHMSLAGDWCPMHPNDPFYKQAVLLLAEAGDLVLWDSRTVHGGRVGSGKEDEKAVQLDRLSCTVSMTPAVRASTEVLRARTLGFLSGQCFNHTPHEAGTSSGTLIAKKNSKYKPPKLSAHQMALLRGQNCS